MIMRQAIICASEGDWIQVGTVTHEGRGGVMGASLPLHGDCVGVMNGNEGGTVWGAHQQGRAGTLWLDGSGRQAVKKRYPIE